MIVYENECVGCTDLGLPCQGETCPKRKVPHLYCDRCDEEKKTYHYDGGHYCMDCIEECLTAVEPWGDDYE